MIDLNKTIQFGFDTIVRLSIWRKHYEAVQLTVYPQILSKYSIHDDLKGQKSITRRFLKYCKSRRIIEDLFKYTFLKKVCGTSAIRRGTYVDSNRQGWIQDFLCGGRAHLKKNGKIFKELGKNGQIFVRQHILMFIFKFNAL